MIKAKYILSLLLVMLFILPDHALLGATFGNQTSRSFVYQAASSLVSPAEVHAPFLVSINEASPIVISAFIQITGVAYRIGAGAASLYSSIDDASFTTTRVQKMNLPANAKGRPFTVLYDVSAHLSSIIQTPSTYNFTWDTSLENVEVDILAAELIITYQFEVVDTTLMPILGILDSSVFDTNTVIGAAYNALSWKGKLGDGEVGRVRLQLATSHCANGATNAPTCSGAENWEFIGGVTCENNDWFEIAASTPLDLQSTGCLPKLNDKRYFRYKVQICSEDCIVPGQFTPEVEDVIINWSP